MDQKVFGRYYLVARAIILAVNSIILGCNLSHSNFGPVAIGVITDLFLLVGLIPFLQVAKDR